MKGPDPEPRPNPTTALCASPANEIAHGASTEGNALAEQAAPDTACQCITCTCTGCHEECYGSCRGCGEPKDHCNSYQTEGEKFVTGLKTLESEARPAPALDTSWMDIQAQVDLELATREYMAGRDMAQRGIRRMADAVAIAHEATCATYGCINTVATICRNGEMAENPTAGQPRNGESGKFEKAERTFGAWCDSLEISRKTAERLLNVAKMFDESSPNQQKVLNELSPSLLYAAARPSAPPELVAGVKNGDITTHKQYQDLLRQVKERDDRVHDLELLCGQKEEKIADLKSDIESVEASRNRLIAERDCARRSEQESRRTADEYLARIKKLEARPIDVAVRQPSEAEIEQYRREGEHRAQNRLDAAQSDAKKLSEKVKSLKEQLQGKADHLAAVEKENARLRAQVGEARRVDAVSCTACIYEPKCCGLNMMDTDEDALDQMNRRLIGCAAGKTADE